MQVVTSAAAVPALAFAGSAPAFARTADRRQWDAAMARFRAAEKEYDDVSNHFNAVERAFFEAKEKIAHVAVGPDPYTGHLDPVTTANTWIVNRARSLMTEIAQGKVKFDDVPGIHEHNEFCRELAAAADARDAAIKALDERLGYSLAETGHEAAVDRMCDARDILLAMPAPDGEALLWKLDWLFFSDSIWEQDYVAPAVADAKKFLAAIH